MAMVRTIQHPGVQIQETEIGGYTNTIVMNNAYIMGYADRGPIYDCSWIMNTRDFTKIYGEPQNEAEKYLFTAVQSILTNGGTPIVARMPYDNKQCKAYKALKLKWADVTDCTGDPRIDSDLASPIVPLSAMTAQLDNNKSFGKIFTTESVTINNKAITSEKLNSLKVIDIVKLLSPYKIGSASSAEGQLWDGIQNIINLKINGTLPASLAIDQVAVSSAVDSIQDAPIAAEKKHYIFDQTGSNHLISSEQDVKKQYIQQIQTDISNLDYQVWEVRETYFAPFPAALTGDPTGVKAALINTFGTDVPEVSGFNVYLPDQIPASLGNEILKQSNWKYLSSYFDVDAISLKSRLWDPTLCKFKGFANIDTFKIAKANNYINWGDSIAYYNWNRHDGFAVDTVINNKQVYVQSTSGQIYNYLKLAVVDSDLTSGNLSALYPFKETGKGNGRFDSTDALLGTYSRIDTASSTINIVSGLIPIYEGTFNGYEITGFVGNVPQCITGQIYTPSSASEMPIGYYNASIQADAIFGDCDGKKVITKQVQSTLTGEVSGHTIQYINHASGAIPAFDVDNYPEEMFENGAVNYQSSYDVTYTAQIANLKVATITDTTVERSQILKWLKIIYNDVRFLNMNKDKTSQFEAKLLETPQMGFKYGLYLDGQDCEISNDQYDDLVTVNQFKAVDRTVDKYGHDIDDANFIIVDKQKTVVQGVGGNIGFFTTIIDPFDALKVQRILVNPVDDEVDPSGMLNHQDSNMNRLDYWAYESANSWNKIYDSLLDSMDTLQRVRNADGIYVGQPNPIDGKLNILDSWAVPLTGTYYDESISKLLMRKFPGIPMADLNSDDLTNPEYSKSIIDPQYSTHIMVAVCKTAIDQGTGKIIVNLVETFFGSLFNEVNIQNGRSLFIGDIINGNSDYIEFYRNNYVSANGGAYDPPEYKRTDVNQIFIKDSEDLKNAAMLRGIDADEYGLDSPDPEVREDGQKKYHADLAKKHIYAIDKKQVCVYNIHWEANFTSFSKKESQKIIANTSGLYTVSDGTTMNVAKNFLVDMDRCINFIKNRDDIPIHFVCDAGLSTIAQFCDNVIWNPNKKSVIGEYVDIYGKKTGKKIYITTGGWITQPFAPDDDPAGEDRYITGYSDIATWRKVVEKIDSICSDIRKDCFAIVDAPRQLTLDGAAPKIRKTKFDNKFDKVIGKCLRYITGFNTSYTAGYYNWLRTTDQYTGKSIWIPPTTKIIGNYCYLNINNLPWLAPAGLTYGLISGCHAISHNPDYQEEDEIYLKSWNYIKQYPVEGFVVEGQKTLLGKESVFERINVRLLFLDLERFAYNVSRTFKYQVNNTYTRQQFVATLKPKFEDYTLRGGIYEYLIKVDSQNNTPQTIDQNQLRGDIFIKPARLIEYILLNFVGTSTGTNFNELPLG